jgi:hypothetical protein
LHYVNLFELSDLFLIYHVYELTYLDFDHELKLGSLTLFAPDKVQLAVQTLADKPGRRQPIIEVETALLLNLVHTISCVSD